MRGGFFTKFAALAHGAVVFIQAPITIHNFSTHLLQKRRSNCYASA